MHAAELSYILSTCGTFEMPNLLKIKLLQADKEINIRLNALPRQKFSATPKLEKG